MNEYTVRDLYHMFKSGDGKGEYSVTMTEKMVNCFLSGFDEVSPIHTDDSFATEQGFKGRIVPQLLILSHLLPLLEANLPGKYCLGLGADEIAFKNPAYVGDTLTFYGELDKVSVAAKMAIMNILVKNQNDDIIIKCKWKVKVLK